MDPTIRPPDGDHSGAMTPPSGRARSAGGGAISVALHLLALAAAIAVVEAGAVDRPRPPETPFTFVMVTRELPRPSVPVPGVVAPEPLAASPLGASVPAPEPPRAASADVVRTADDAPERPAALPEPPVAEPEPDPGPTFDSAVAAPAPVERGTAGPVVGLFDRPVGLAPAAGSGDGAAVRAAGFAVAAPPPAPHPPPQRPAAGAGFDVEPARPARPAIRPVVTTDAPVQILFKPVPDYTDEARSLGIEGEVVLDVEFAASSEVRVLGVVRGLGHGLDEAAARAALRIRFRPAERGGRAVDSRAKVHISFRLSSTS